MSLIPNWNKERWRTRDRLLDYDSSIMPPHPYNGDIALPVVYPWENVTLSVLSHQLYEIALQNGFSGTEENFLKKFSNGSNEKEIIVGTIATFPENGQEDYLYLDRETGILYYFSDVYLPIRSLLIEDTNP